MCTLSVECIPSILACRDAAALQVSVVHSAFHDNPMYCHVMVEEPCYDEFLKLRILTRWQYELCSCVLKCFHQC